MKLSLKVDRVFSDVDHDAISDIAADWLARHEIGLTMEEKEAFSEWLLADPRHVAAIAEIESAWRFMQKPRITGQIEHVARAVAQKVALRDRSRRRRLLGLSFAITAVAAVVALSFVPLRSLQRVQSIEVAGKVEVKPERRMLVDDSVVELNAGAEISVDFTPLQRGVRLVRGEAHFTVAKDTTRPFVVTAGAVSVRAVGTEFAVRVEPAAVGVLVTEGRVAVNRNDASPTAPASPVDPETTYVTAGSRTVVPIDIPAGAPLQVQSLAATQIKSALAWRSMRLEFTAAPLYEIVARFNRQNGTQLSLGDPELGAICISGIFWLDDPEGFSRLIEASTGLAAIHNSSGGIVISKR